MSLQLGLFDDDPTPDPTAPVGPEPALARHVEVAGRLPAGLRLGNSMDFNLSARGGTGSMGYFLSFNESREDGVFFNNLNNRTAGRGNLLGALGMLLAVLVTLVEVARGENAVAFLNVEGRAKEIRVRLGERIGDLIEVEGEGIAEGAEVIAGQVHFIQDGEAVSVARRRKSDQ